MFTVTFFQKRADEPNNFSVLWIWSFLQKIAVELEPASLAKTRSNHMREAVYFYSKHIEKARPATTTLNPESLWAICEELFTF